MRRRPASFLSIRATLCAALLLVAGCESSPSNLLQAMQADCRQGKAEACAMLSSLENEKSDEDIAPPTSSREIVQAILAGMRRARMQAQNRYPQETSPALGEPKATP